MIDLHCHLLPGLDDGPSDLVESLRQARAHVAAGVQTVVCTPHVDQTYPNDAARIRDAVIRLQLALETANIPLRILPGAEVALSRAMELSNDDLCDLHLAGTDCLLLEPPLSTDVPRMGEVIRTLQSRGHRVLLAHPERCIAFHNDPELLGELVAGGALAQVTAASFTGRFGRTVERVARTMLDDGFVHVIASDAHSFDRRPPGLLGPLQDANLPALAPWACKAVPQAILADLEIPPRPESAAAKRRIFRRR